MTNPLIMKNKEVHTKPVRIRCLRLQALLFLVVLSSCGRYVLFQRSDSAAAQKSYSGSGGEDSSQTLYERPISVDDKITVSIWEHEDISIGSVHSIYSLLEENGKWLAVDQQGEINLPQVGPVKLAGLTVREGTLYLEKIYSKFIQHPVINLRVINKQVTILGEVRKPGSYAFSSDNIKLVDLLGKAEGFTDFAKTTRIKIIRGTEQPKEILVDYTNVYSLASADAMIRTGDVVYVPPTAGKSTDRFTSKLIPIASLITAIVLIFTVATK